MKPSTPPSGRGTPTSTSRRLASVTLAAFLPTGALAQDATTLADEGTRLVFEVLPVDSSWLACRFGVPTTEQRDHVKRVTAALNMLVPRVELAVDDAVRAGETLEIERRRRLPFLLGVTAYLDGRHKRAAELLVPLADELPEGAATHASLYAGLALIGEQRWDEAESVLDTKLDPRTREGLATRLALAEVAAGRDDTQAGLDTLDTLAGEVEGVLFCELLIADRRFAWTGDWRAYMDLLAGNPSAATRLAVFDRLTRLDADLDDAPDLARVAAAVGDPARLEGLLAGRLDDAARGEALLALGVARIAEGDLEAARTPLSRLVTDHSRHYRAEAAAQLLGSVAATTRHREALELLLARYPNVDGVGLWRYVLADLDFRDSDPDAAIARLERIPRGDTYWAPAQVLRVAAYAKSGRYERVIEVAERVASLVGDPHRRPIELCRVEALLALGRDEEALVIVRTMPGAAAQRLRILALERLGRTDEITRELDNLDGVMLAEMLQRRMDAGDETVDAIAEALARWIDRHGGSATQQLAVADALRLAGRHDAALRRYERLVSEHGESLEAVFGRAECLYALGEDADAIAAFKRLSTVTDAGGGDVFWQSQLRMLQILARTGRNTERIRPHVQRLRRRDRNLGGERYRREFERLLLEQP